MKFFKDHFTVLRMDSENRMLRLGFGFNKGTPFIRIDLWWIGFRISGKEVV